jgi:drug/metabolite transporter (DMT)-like permease
VINRRSFINLGLLSLMNLMAGSQFPVYKHAADHMSDSALTFYSFSLAILMLVPLLLRERRAASRVPRSHPITSRSLNIKAWLLLGASQLPSSVGLSWGIAHSSGSNGAIIYMTLPLIILILSVPMLGERLTWIRIVTFILALIGTIFVSRDDLIGGRFTMSTLLGNMMILSGVLGSAFFVIYSKKVLEHYSGLEVLVYSYTVSAVLCALASQIFDAKPFYDVAGIPASTWIAIAVLGWMVWGASMVLFLWLLKRLDVAQFSISLYQQTFFGILLSAVLLGEHLRLAQIVGGLTVIIATLLAESHARRVARAVNTT